MRIRFNVTVFSSADIYILTPLFEFINRFICTTTHILTSNLTLSVVISVGPSLLHLFDLLLLPLIPIPKYFDDLNILAQCLNDL